MGLAPVDICEEVSSTSVTVQRFIFHPLIVFLVASAAALLYAGWVTWRFPGGSLTHHYIYVVPVVVPCVAFLFDRVERILTENIGQRTIDVTVVAAATMRMMGLLPLLSGHALFLTYAVIRPGSPLTRITAGGLMIEVIYLKLFVWHDPASPAVGVILGCLAGIVCTYQDKRLTRQLAVKQ